MPNELEANKQAVRNFLVALGKGDVNGSTRILD